MIIVQFFSFYQFKHLKNELRTLFLPLNGCFQRKMQMLQISPQPRWKRTDDRAAQ